ncbi:MAG: FosX/FosE/FosI family fosfomycin resistance thiol transferase [Magnetovibrio sp.]|nr:FosX/FosE/FosI family fosfomycin resistance thiol transferase [Magnetovibrio sp.]
MIQTLSHMTFVVQSLDKMENLLVNIFDAQKVYDSGDKMFSLSKERFFLIGDIWVAIMEGESLSSKTYNHIAFKIDEDDFHSYLERIQSLGLEVSQGRPRVKGEGLSIYFYDYDNHMFELHTGNLQERLQRYERDR